MTNNRRNDSVPRRKGVLKRRIFVYFGCIAVLLFVVYKNLYFESKSTASLKVKAENKNESLDFMRAVGTNATKIHDSLNLESVNEHRVTSEKNVTVTHNNKDITNVDYDKADDEEEEDGTNLMDDVNKPLSNNDIDTKDENDEVTGTVNVDLGVKKGDIDDDKDIDEIETLTDDTEKEVNGGNNDMADNDEDGEEIDTETELEVTDKTITGVKGNKTNVVVKNTKDDLQNAEADVEEVATADDYANKDEDDVGIDIKSGTENDDTQNVEDTNNDALDITVDRNSHFGNREANTNTGFDVKGVLTKPDINFNEYINNDDYDHNGARDNGITTVKIDMNKDGVNFKHDRNNANVDIKRQGQTFEPGDNIVYKDHRENIVANIKGNKHIGDIDYGADRENVGIGLNEDRNENTDGNLNDYRKKGGKDLKQYRNNIKENKIDGDSGLRQDRVSVGNGVMEDRNVASTNINERINNNNAHTSVNNAFNNDITVAQKGEHIYDIDNDNEIHDVRIDDKNDLNKDLTEMKEGLKWMKEGLNKAIFDVKENLDNRGTLVRERLNNAKPEDRDSVNIPETGFKDAVNYGGKRNNAGPNNPDIAVRLPINNDKTGLIATENDDKTEDKDPRSNAGIRYIAGMNKGGAYVKYHMNNVDSRINEGLSMGGRNNDITVNRDTTNDDNNVKLKFKPAKNNVLRINTVDDIGKQRSNKDDTGEAVNYYKYLTEKEQLQNKDHVRITNITGFDIRNNSLDTAKDTPEMIANTRKGPVANVSKARYLENDNTTNSKTGNAELNNYSIIKDIATKLQQLEEFVEDMFNKSKLNALNIQGNNALRSSKIKEKLREFSVKTRNILHLSKSLLESFSINSHDVGQGMVEMNKKKLAELYSMDVQDLAKDTSALLSNVNKNVLDITPQIKLLWDVRYSAEKLSKNMNNVREADMPGRPVVI